MVEYTVRKEDKWLTGNMQTGRHEFTKNREHRYTFDKSRAQQAAEHYGGTVEEERQPCSRGFAAFHRRMWGR